MTGDAIILADVRDSTEFAGWLLSVRGKFVLVSPPEPSCRPDDDWTANAMPQAAARMRRARAADSTAWRDRLARTGYTLGLGTGSLGRRLEEAGVAGVVVANWAGGWGVDHVFYTQTNAPQRSC